MSVKSVFDNIIRKLARNEKTIEEVKRLTINSPFMAGKASLQTIAAGEITVTRPHVVVLPESGIADNLDIINNYTDGKFIVISTADVGDTITVRDESISGGNIALRGVTTKVLSDPEDSILLIYKESVGFWIQTGVTTGSGGTPDAHAASHQHGGTDEVATVTPGANAIPKAAGTGLIANGWLDATLASLANLGTVADRIAYTTGVDVWAETPLTSFARTILDDANQAAVQATLALVPGTDVQAYSALLASIAGLSSVADRGIYFTGINTAALFTLTSFARTFLDDIDGPTALTTIGALPKAGGTMTGALNMGSNLITNVTDPASAQDAATKAYVDAVASGLDTKSSVRAATTDDITLSGAQTIDGVSVIAGDRVLVKDQSAGSQNGIYVAAAGAWSRATDADTSAEVTSGMYTFVTEGTVNGDKGYALITNDPITLDTTALVFSQFSGPANVAASIDGSSETTTPLDAHRFAITVSGILSWLSYANLKTALTTIFNGLYVALTGNQTVAGQKSFSDDMYLTGGKFFYMTDPDVAHGMTDLFPTDIFAAYGQSSGTLGGIALYGLSDGNAQAALIRAIIGTSTPTLPPILFRGSKKNGTGEQALAAGEIVFALDNALTRLFVIMGNADVGVGITPAAKLHVFQPTLGSNVIRHQSTATNDDPTQDFLQGRIATTNATVTTLFTMMIPASHTCNLEAVVTARRTGGTAGTAEDGASYKIAATFKNVAGVATQIGATTVLWTHEDQAAWDCVFDVTGGDARVRVTGATNNNITWHAHVFHRFLST